MLKSPIIVIAPMLKSRTRDFQPSNYPINRSQVVDHELEKHEHEQDPYGPDQHDRPFLGYGRCRSPRVTDELEHALQKKFFGGFRRFVICPELVR